MGDDPDPLLANGSPVQAKLDLLMSSRRGRPPKLDPSLIITPSFRMLDGAGGGEGGKRPLPSASPTPGSGALTAVAGPTSPSTPTLSSLAFFRRHLPQMRAERRMRLQQRQESTESWIICDFCRKWRLLKGGTGRASPPQFFCGGGKKPKAEECARLDDWIVRCVGESRARQLSDVGVATVEGMERSGVRAEKEKRMERLGMYFDRETQKIKRMITTG